MHRVMHLIRKELLELKRDPRLFGIVVMAPIVQLMVLGYAATTDVKDVPIVIVDADRSTASRDLVHRFETSENFQIVDMLGSTSEIDPYLDGGEAWMAISIPPDYGRKIASSRQTSLQIVADVFNLFDKQTGYDPQPALTSPVFGEPRRHYEPRRFQVAARFLF